ncbi:MAG: hypothetical protein ABSH56_12850 [Bryobacteraceae bacterium]
MAHSPGGERYVFERGGRSKWTFGTRVLVVHMSGNWDDGGNLANDMGSLGEARLIAKVV